MQRSNENKKNWINFVKSEAKMQHHHRCDNTLAQGNRFMLCGLKSQVNNLVMHCYRTVSARLIPWECKVNYLRMLVTYSEAVR